MSANGEIDIAGMQIGGTAVPIIQTSCGAAGTNPLYLNLYSDNDVHVGRSAYARGLVVDSTGPSSFAGNVNVTGSLTAATVYANYQDVAEWVPASEPMPAGTVVVLNDAAIN